MSAERVDVPYRATPYQADFHRARLEGFDYRWASMGVGTGKTTMGVVEDVALAHENPGMNGLIVVPDFASFYKAILPTWSRWIPPQLWRLKRVAGQPCIELPHIDVTIWVCSAARRDTVDKIVAFEIAWAHMDEMSRFALPEQAWDNTLERMRAAGAKWSGIHVTSTPRPGSLAELFGVEDGISDEALDRGIHTKTEHHEGEAFRYWVRRAAVEDNPYTPPAYKQRMRARFTGDFALQELGGQVVTQQNRIFPEWHDGLHVLPNELADKLWKRTRRRKGGVDWGYTSPACNLIGGWLSDGELLIVDEWYRRGQQSEVQGMAALTMELKHCGGWGRRRTPIDWLCDPEEPESIAKWSKGFRWDNPETGDYERIRVSAKKAKNAWRPSIDGINMLLSRRGGVPHPLDPPRSAPTGAPRLYVAQRCANLRREMKAWKWKLDKDGQVLGDREFVGSNHAIDCARYIVNAEGLGLVYSGIMPEDLD